jgi:predicted RND superfamily exporter protein
VLIGLAAKNAILIVEFAKERQAEGLSRREAAVEAARVRLRPIMMTSAAFILGVLPLVLGKGAGAEMRNALGVAVFSGMLGVTFFGIFFTPVFYSVISWLGERAGKPKEVPAAPPAAEGAPSCDRESTQVDGAEDMPRWPMDEDPRTPSPGVVVLSTVTPMPDVSTSIASPS